MLVGVKDRNLILAFDVSEEAFREIPLPECVSNVKPMSSTSLLKYGQSIAAMTFDCEGEAKQTLWVMKEYGVAMSWTNVFMQVAESLPIVLFFRQDEEQMLAWEKGWIASVDIKNKHSEIFGVRAIDSHREMDSVLGYPAIDGFVESLVLLDNSNACGDDENPREDARYGDSNEKGSHEDDASSIDDDLDDSDEDIAHFWDVNACDEDPQEDANSVDGDSTEKGSHEDEASSIFDYLDDSDEDIAPLKCNIC
ncbi:hypothetical protein COLO4_12965 [Corchorus olitorius]|uniref:Uncharacterized protein n=1 Tax=Corchorus olitorius TaxID=93759 RepID=A0A1R3JZ84_9ROSI|nr:hypothetical protein COLO4_12965 [Corchorus olitorius]